MSSEKQPPSLRPQSNLYSGWKPQNPSSTVTKSPGSTSSFPSSTSHKTISSPTSGFSPSGGSSFASPKPSFVGNRQNFYSFPTSQSSPSSPSSDTMAGSNATQTSLISIPALQGIAVESDSPSLLINSSNFPALNAPALSTSPRSNSLPLSNLFVDEQRKSHSPSTLPSLSVPANEVPLESSWSFWFFRPTLSSSTDLSRESSLRFVGCFTSIEGFWRFANHLKPPSQLEPDWKYFFFRSSNRAALEKSMTPSKGGEWMITIHKKNREYVDQTWEKILLTLIGESFNRAEELNGVILTRRQEATKISIWTQSVDELTVVALESQITSKIIDPEYMILEPFVPI